MFRSYCVSAGHKKERGSELRGFLNFIHSVLFWALLVGYTAIIHAAWYITALFIKDKEKKRAFYEAGARLWGSLAFWTSLGRVEVTGLENIPRDTNVIFTPNHQSFLDIFILLKCLPSPYRFIIMRKLFRLPMIGYHITKSGFVSLDRKDRKKSIKTIHDIIDLLKEGVSCVIFPEGKLTADGTVGTFGRGASIIIQNSRKPVVPVAIDGSFFVMPKGAWKIRRRKVTVRIGRPVSFDRYYDVINRESSERLARELRELVVELKEK